MGSKFISEGFGSLYRLGEPNVSRAFRASLSVSVDDAISYLRGEAKPARPIVATWVMGRRQPTDLIWTTSRIPLVAERVLDVLRDIHAQGWGTYPVEVRGKAGESFAGYHGLAVLGRCGPIDESRSITKLKKYPARMVPMLRGLYFDEATWDGTDIFMTVPPATWKFVTAPVKEALEKAKVKNLTFTPATEVERIKWPA